MGWRAGGEVALIGSGNAKELIGMDESVARSRINAIFAKNFISSQQIDSLGDPTHPLHAALLNMDSANLSRLNMKCKEASVDAFAFKSWMGLLDRIEADTEGEGTREWIAQVREDNEFVLLDKLIQVRRKLLLEARDAAEASADPGCGVDVQEGGAELSGVYAAMASIVLSERYPSMVERLRNKADGVSGLGKAGPFNAAGGCGEAEAAWWMVAANIGDEGFAGVLGQKPCDACVLSKLGDIVGPIGKMRRPVADKKMRRLAEVVMACPEAVLGLDPRVAESVNDENLDILLSYCNRTDIDNKPYRFWLGSMLANDRRRGSADTLQYLARRMNANADGETVGWLLDERFVLKSDFVNLASESSRNGQPRKPLFESISQNMSTSTVKTIFELVRLSGLFAAVWRRQGGEDPDGNAAILSVETEGGSNVVDLLFAFGQEELAEELRGGGVSAQRECANGDMLVYFNLISTMFVGSAKSDDAGLKGGVEGLEIDPNGYVPLSFVRRWDAEMEAKYRRLIKTVSSPEEFVALVEYFNNGGYRLFSREEREGLNEDQALRPFLLTINLGRYVEDQGKELDDSIGDLDQVKRRSARSL